MDDQSYYVIVGCLIYICFVGYCAYKCSDYSPNNRSCLSCWSNRKENSDSINYTKV